MILELFQSVFEHAEMARVYQARNDFVAAKTHLAKARLGISGLAFSVQAEATHASDGFLQVYDFALHQLDKGDSASIQNAIRALAPIKEGFEAIAPEARQLEAAGNMPSLDARLVSVTA